VGGIELVVLDKVGGAVTRVGLNLDPKPRFAPREAWCFLVSLWARLLRQH
jgi:hypothetical protein